MAGNAGRTGLAAVLTASQAVDQPTDRATLTEQQAKLVELLASGVFSIEAAGELAGYSCKQSASRASRLPHVQAAIREQVEQHIVVAAPAALATLTSLAAKSGSERIRADVATALLERAGIGASRQQGASGPAVVLNLHVSGDIATMLTQRPVIEHATQAQQGVGAGDHHPTEVEGGQGEGEGQPATPPRAPRRPAAKAKGRGRKPAAKPGARAPRMISPSKTRGSGNRKGGKDGE